MQPPLIEIKSHGQGAAQLASAAAAAKASNANAIVAGIRCVANLVQATSTSDQDAASLQRSAYPCAYAFKGFEKELHLQYSVPP